MQKALHCLLVHPWFPLWNPRWVATPLKGITIGVCPVDTQEDAGIPGKVGSSAPAGSDVAQNQPTRARKASGHEAVAVSHEVHWLNEKEELTAAHYVLDSMVRPRSDYGEKYPQTCAASFTRAEDEEWPVPLNGTKEEDGKRLGSCRCHPSAPGTVRGRTNAVYP